MAHFPEEAHNHEETIVKDGDEQWGNVRSDGYASDNGKAAHDVSEAGATDGMS